MIPFSQSIGSEETQLCLSCFPLPGAIPKPPWQELAGLLCYLFFTVSLLKSSRYRLALFSAFLVPLLTLSDKWIV